MKNYVYIALGMLLAFPQAKATEKGNQADISKSYDLIFRGGFSKGGKTIDSWTKYYPSMADPSGLSDKPNIKTGSALFLGIGLEFYFDSNPYSVEVSAEHHSSGFFIFPDTSGAEFKKLVFNVIPSFSYGAHKLGVGVTYHHNPTFSDDIPNNPYEYYDSYLGSISPVVDLNFNSAFGSVIQYSYGKGVLKWGVRAISISYETTGLNTIGSTYEQNTSPRYYRELSGNSISVFIQSSFSAK